MNSDEMQIADTIMHYFQTHRSLEWEYVDSEQLWNIPYRKADQILAALIREDLLIQRNTFTDITFKGNAYSTYANHLVEEEKRKQKATNTHITVGENFQGNLNTGNIQGDQSFLDKSFNPQASSNTPTTKSKITVESILKITAAIITLALAVLKGCNII